MPLVDPVTGAGIAQTKEKDAIQKSFPIETLDSQISQGFTHIQPVLLLAWYATNFGRLVADPVEAMAMGLLPLTVLQVAWCVLCLPLAGSVSKKDKGGKKKVGVGAFKGADAKGKNSNDVTLVEKIVPTIICLLLAQVAVPIIFVLQILLGAPLTTHLPHTILSSAHIVLLAVFPLIYVHGAEQSRWFEIAGLQAPIDDVFGSTVGVLLGAWLGAVPIPLDWDREWQKWPVTVVTGAYLGLFVGRLAGRWIFRGKRIPLN